MQSAVIVVTDHEETLAFVMRQALEVVQVPTFGGIQYRDGAGWFQAVSERAQRRRGFCGAFRRGGGFGAAARE